MINRRRKLGDEYQESKGKAKLVLRRGRRKFGEVVEYFCREKNG
jgi:hypothetical protein